MDYTTKHSSEPGLSEGLLLNALVAAGEAGTLDEALDGLTLDDFNDPRNRAIFALIADVREDDGTVDRHSVIARAELDGGVDVDLLLDLLDEPVDPQLASSLAMKLRDARLKTTIRDRLAKATTAAASNGVPAADLLKMLREDLQRTEAEAGELRGEAEARFQFHNAADFDKLDLRREYHIRGIMAAGPVPTILGGSFKTLKTSIAMDLLISLATGSRFLNQYPVSEQIPVAVMSGESGGFALQSLARRVALSKGWTLGGIGDYFRICPSVLDLGDPGDLAAVEKFITENGIRVFVLDPTYLAMKNLRSDEAGSLFAMGRFLEPLARIGERTGCTPVIVHHNSRGATRAREGEPAELADIAWSGFAEWAGQWLLLARREAYDPDSNGEHRLWMTAGGRDGHSALVGVNVTEGRHDDPGGRRWEVEVEEAGTARREAIEAAAERQDDLARVRREKQLEQDQQAIVEVMRKVGTEGETKTGIRDRTGLRGERFNPAFAQLLTAGTIIESEISKGNNRKYTGFKLHPDAPGRNGTQPGQNPRTAAIATETDGPL